MMSYSWVVLTSCLVGAGIAVWLLCVEAKAEAVRRQMRALAVEEIRSWPTGPSGWPSTDAKPTKAQRIVELERQLAATKRSRDWYRARYRR